LSVFNPDLRSPNCAPAGPTLPAIRKAILNESVALAAHYRQRLAELGVPTTISEAVEHFPACAALSLRESAILRHVDLLTNEPRAATKAQMADLLANGLNARDIVTIAQLITFLSFQVRLFVGLQLLGSTPSIWLTQPPNRLRSWRKAHQRRKRHPIICCWCTTWKRCASARGSSIL
jgi:uncharacterized protein YciW